MKYGLVSDIHANLEAFEAVLGALEQERVDRYVFVGDIVGYGAEPKRCLGILKNLVKDPGCVCVAGNHDSSVCGLSGSEYYNMYARQSIYWTQRQLDDDDMKFLKQLKLVEQEDHFTVVHANLMDPGSWGYVLDIDDAFPNFKLLDDPVCFIGHSHKPVVFTASEMVDRGMADKITIEKGKKYIINIGSVGQPRDGNPKACFGVYDQDAATIEIRRVAYDVATAQKKILDAGLPRFLAERLSLGK